jgi:hypothetical protein
VNQLVYLYVKLVDLVVMEDVVGLIRFVIVTAIAELVTQKNVSLVTRMQQLVSSNVSLLAQANKCASEIIRVGNVMDVRKVFLIIMANGNA